MRIYFKMYNLGIQVSYMQRILNYDSEILTTPKIHIFKNINS